VHVCVHFSTVIQCLICSDTSVLAYLYFCSFMVHGQTWSPEHKLPDQHCLDVFVDWVTSEGWHVFRTSVELLVDATDTHRLMGSSL